MKRENDLDVVAPDEVGTEAPIVEKVYGITGHTKHPLSSLLINPDVFTFEEKAQQEKVLVVARSHWVTNVGWILTAILMLLAPSLLSLVPFSSDISTRYKILGGFLWFLVTFAFIFERFLSWYFDVIVITDRRVIDIDFDNLLSKKFAQADILMIQDLTFKVTGFAQTMFNFGDVFVQTAAEVPQITLERIPQPQKIIMVLQMLKEELGGKNVK
jgi:hypothetical protein